MIRLSNITDFVFGFISIVLLAAIVTITACDDNTIPEENSRTPLAAVTPSPHASNGARSGPGMLESEEVQQETPASAAAENNVASESPAPAVTPAQTASLPTAIPTVPLPTPIPGLIGPNDFAENVNPLTGLTVADREILARRPIAIKVSNNARVRPQAGLNSADIVFEHLTEGGITRFTAIFYMKF